MDELFMCSDKELLAVGTDLLVFGTGKGMERNLFSLFRYSILTNSWIRTDPMNYPRCLFAKMSVGQKAYLAGGSDCYGKVLSSVEIVRGNTDLISQRQFSPGRLLDYI
jgi:hypothetical protein